MNGDRLRRLLGISDPGRGLTWAHHIPRRTRRSSRRHAGRRPPPANGARGRAELLVVADRARVEEIVEQITARGPLAVS